MKTWGLYSLILYAAVNFILAKEINSQNYKYGKSKNGSKFLEELPAQSSNEIRITNSEYNESDINAAINPKNDRNIIVLPMQHRWDNVKTYYAIPPYYSFDFGETWKRANFELLPKRDYRVIKKGGNPEVIFDKNGRAYVSWIVNYYTSNGSENDSVFSSVIWGYSDDGGVNWVTTENNQILTLKNYDEDGTLVEEIKNLRLISNPLGKKYDVEIYALLELYNNLENKNTFKLYSYDEYHKEFVLRNNDIRHISDSIQIGYPDIDISLEGELGIAYYSKFIANERSKYFIKYRQSRSGGFNFDEPKIISEFFFKGSVDIASQFDLIPGTSYLENFNPTIEIKIDKSNTMNYNNYYCQWVGTGLEEVGTELDVYLARSLDEGDSWGEIIKVNSNTFGEQFLSDLNLNDNGVLVSKWYDTHKYEDRESADIYMGYSFDGGLSFGESFRVSSSSSSLSVISEQNRYYGLGKKMSILATDEYSIPIWADARKNDGKTDAFIGFFPLEEQAAKYFDPQDSLIYVEEIKPVPAKDHLDISFLVKERRFLSLLLYDSSGRIVYRFYERNMKAGRYNESLSLKLFASGFYYLVFKSDVYSLSKQILIIK